MNNTIKYLILITLLSGIMTGCLKVLEFEEKDIKPMMVVNCFLTNDSMPSLDLTYTVSAIDDKEYFESIKNAKIVFKENGEILNTEFSYVKEFDSISEWNNNGYQTFTVFENGKYKNNATKLGSGNTYNIEISADGFETIKAETVIPKEISIEKVDTFSASHSDEYSTYYERKAKVFFTDPAGETNYYRIKTDIAYLNIGKGDMDSLEIFPSYSSGWVNSDDPVFGTEDTEDIFGGSSYNRFSIFDDKIFEGKTYGLSLTLNTEYKYFDQGYYGGYESGNYTFYIFRVTLHSLSEPMYYYLNTVAKQQNGGMALFTEPVLVYTNIENGAGVFAGYSESEIYIVSHNLKDEMMSIIPSGLSNKELFDYIKKLYDEYMKQFGGYY